ncbi:hypothetical protein BDR03DRAFT_968398 [Suillus americanus]|nr:hypothetical protein BDR03DRAFT_968398 [Suillus americanus]
MQNCGDSCWEQKAVLLALSLNAVLHCAGGHGCLMYVEISLIVIFGCAQRRYANYPVYARL